jgi:beta-lactamase regulating signal transducer with metallopeptidase domain
MTFELAIVLKVTAVLALGLTVARMAHRTRASVRYVMLACTFGALLALPTVSALAPAMVVEIPIVWEAGFTLAVAESATAPMPEEAAQAADSPATSMRRWSLVSTTTVLRTVWAAGAALLLVTLSGSLWKIRRIRRRGTPWIAGQATANAVRAQSGVLRPVAVLLHEGVAAPVTCGLVCPAILLPPDAREWSKSDLKRAFVHELEHVRRGDSLINFGARAICAAYWFHPLVWIAWRQLRLESERACDDAVVSDTERADYADQLVTLAERLSHTQPQALLSMASRSDLSVRVTAVLDQAQLRGRAGAAAVAATVGAAVLFVGLIAPARAVAVSRRSTAVDARQTMRADATTLALNVRLVEAAQRGDLNSVTELLNSGGDVNAVELGDGSPLIVAARGGHMNVVRLLLDRGADPNLAVPGDGNPLIMAAHEGHGEIVKVLLDRGANIDQMVPEDENPLIQASAGGRLEVVRLLVTRGANVNARAWAAAAPERTAGEWRTPLSMARKHRHDAIVRYLVSVGAVD